MNIYTDLAKKTIEKYAREEKLPETKNLAKDLLTKRAGCFVSIHGKNDELRGCIGTIVPVYKNLGSEIIANAIEAGFRDLRFSPIKKEELKNLKYSVDVLGEPEKIDSEKKLDPKKFGVIVKSTDGRTGLLLPNLDGVSTIEKQIDIACEKAGIIKNEKVLLYRFESQRYE